MAARRTALSIAVVALVLSACGSASASGGGECPLLGNTASSVVKAKKFDYDCSLTLASNVSLIFALLFLSMWGHLKWSLNHPRSQRPASSAQVDA